MNDKQLEAIKQLGSLGCYAAMDTRLCKAAYDEIESLREQLASRDAEIATLRKQVNKLLFAVERKFPNESRFETALRYIREAELNANEALAATEPIKEIPE